MGLMRYIAVVGINYPGKNGTEVRVEPGGEVPASIIKSNQWLVSQQCVRQVSGEDDFDGVPSAN